MLLLVSASAFAQPLTTARPRRRNAQGDVAVTIYNNNWHWCRTAAPLASRGRRARIPRRLGADPPETVTLSGTVLASSSNFDFDLLSPAALMPKAVGEAITIVRNNPASGAETRERATVLSANNGVVLRIGNRIEVLRDDGIPTRVIFDKVPENLARAHLVVTVERRAAGASR